VITRSSKIISTELNDMNFLGACINDTIVDLSFSGFPFSDFLSLFFPENGKFDDRIIMWQNNPKYYPRQLFCYSPLKSAIFERIQNKEGLIFVNF
jgi:hypothetical protein